jgi:hypothetical protein
VGASVAVQLTASFLRLASALSISSIISVRLAPVSPAIPHRAPEQKYGAGQNKNERREVGQVGAEMLKADNQARSHEQNDGG